MTDYLMMRAPSPLPPPAFLCQLNKNHVPSIRIDRPGSVLSAHCSRRMRNNYSGGLQPTKEKDCAGLGLISCLLAVESDVRL